MRSQKADSAHLMTYVSYTGRNKALGLLRTMTEMATRFYDIKANVAATTDMYRSSIGCWHRSRSDYV